MDEKTAELRDIFLDATGEETVGERGGERRGSLTDVETPERIDARLRDLLLVMRGRYDFETGLDSAAYVRLIRGFFDGQSDEDVADAVGLDPETVTRARLDCHLVREDDRDHPAFDEIRDRIVADGTGRAAATDEAVADAVDADVETVAHVRRVVAAADEAVRANDRFRDAFAELLTDDDLSGRLASDSRVDGLREATEDIETDVSF